MSTIAASHTTTDADAVSTPPARWPMLAAATYVGAWIAGLTAFGAGPASDATDAEVSQYFAHHRLATTTQALLIHAVAAVALYVVLVALRRAGASNRLAHSAGVAGVGISLVQFVLDVWRSTVSRGATTSTLVDAIDRLDGLKMLAFAAMIAAASSAMRGAGIIRRRMSAVGGLAAVALVASGIAYAAASDGKLATAAVSLVLLLGWVGFTGVAAGRRLR
jgi:hypothetical protein